jgi:putative hemolysin
MVVSSPEFSVRLADGPEDLRAAQRLRYEVFVAELGADGPHVDHNARLEKDEFDPFFDHLLLEDLSRASGDQVVAVYRLLRDDQMPSVGRYYSETEYDLTVLKHSGRKLMELGRSCLHPEYRGGAAMLVMWNGLAEYVADHGIEVMFGTASFHGTDVAALAPSLSLLHERHLAPPELRVRAVAERFQPMDLIPYDQIDRKPAMLGVPALIKAYLRLGGYVGEGAFVDHAFNTTDICLVMDVHRLSSAQKSIYSKGLKA